MSLTVNAKAYNADSFQQNQIEYFGPAKTVSAKDNLVLKRVAPKPSGAFSGVGRATARLTRTLPLTGALTPTGDSVFDVEVSVPVGFTAADIDTLCSDMGAYIASAAFKTLLKTQQINF